MKAAFHVLGREENVIKKMKLVEIVYEAVVVGSALFLCRSRHPFVAVKPVEISYNLYFGVFKACQLFRVQYLFEFVVIVQFDFAFEFFLLEQSL